MQSPFPHLPVYVPPYLRSVETTTTAEYETESEVISTFDMKEPVWSNYQSFIESSQSQVELSTSVQQPFVSSKGYSFVNHVSHHEPSWPVLTSTTTKMSSAVIWHDSRRYWMLYNFPLSIATFRQGWGKTRRRKQCMKIKCNYGVMPCIHYTVLRDGVGEWCLLFHPAYWL